jgi:hypothetical protein
LLPHINRTSSTYTELPPPPSCKGGGRPVNTSGGRGRRDVRLAQYGAWLMTGPPALPASRLYLPPLPLLLPLPLPLPLPRHRPLLPLLTSPPATPITSVCPGDVIACPDGKVVSRDIVDGGCNFAPCPNRAYPVGTAGGHFFPRVGVGRKCCMRRWRAPAKLGVGRVPQGDKFRLLRGLLHSES